MRVLISGYYGFGNVGDEAVLQSIVQGLPEYDLTVLSAVPALTEDIFKIKTIYRFGWLKILRTMLRTDLFISGGGTLFQNITSQRSLLYYLGLVLLAKLFRKKVVVLGQGFGPLKGIFTRLLTRFILNKVDLIMLRDKNSFDAAQKLGIRKPRMELTADPTATLALTSAEEGKKILSLEGIKKDKRPLVGVVLRKPVRGLAENFIRVVAETADWLATTHNYYPVFILYKYPDDIDITSKVMKLMEQDSSIIFRVCQAKEMLALTSQLDLLVGMRLHSLIFATMNSVPALGLSYDPKVSAFMESTEQAYVEINEISDSKTLKNHLEEIILNKNRIKSDLDKKKRQLKDLAASNFEHLESLSLRGKKDITSKTQRALRGNTINFSGIEVDNLTMNETVAQVGEFLSSSKPHLIVTPNPEMIMACQKDKELRTIVNSADLRVPDGISMVVVSKIMKKPLKERVSGIDLMLEIIKSFPNRRIFLLGGKPGVAEEAAAKLKANIVGTLHGYFEGNNKVVQLIKETKPDILFAGLGAGRQEKWLAKHLKELNVRVAMGIGGSLDIVSGRKKRAPKFIQKHYIEWLYRLISEPKRWKRQLALPKFLYLTLFK
ncbi:polysaccharide pyruvyl transferase CsaB [Candidatus Margulisiibacteriota bacterium]